MKIVIDDKIPFIKGLLEPFSEVIYLPGREIKHDDVKHADALLVRTRTKCNADLLQGSNVRFVGTATIGFDHIDTEYCKQNAIFWTNAPGSNASSVAQYIIASLLLFSMENAISLKGKTIGIVGVGHVGKKVEAICRLFGMNILLNDPPRAESENGFVSLETIASESDFISFHTPLTYTGKYPTFHLADENFFRLVKKQPVIINTARGEVIDSRFLKMAWKKKTISGMIIDCWENEPDIDREIVADAYLATPHIAGYSTDGKANASRMIIKALANFFNLPIDISRIQPSFPENNLIDLGAIPENRVEKAILTTYNPEDDSFLLKQTPARFEYFRETYKIRREFPAYTVCQTDPEERLFLAKLGFQV